MPACQPRRGRGRGGPRGQDLPRGPGLRPRVPGQPDESLRVAGEAARVPGGSQLSRQGGLGQLPPPPQGGPGLSPTLGPLSTGAEEDVCVCDAGRCVRVQPRVCTPPAAVLYRHTPAWFPSHAALTHPRTCRVVPPWGLWPRAPRGPRARDLWEGCRGPGPWGRSPSVCRACFCAVGVCLPVACVRACAGV